MEQSPGYANLWRRSVTWNDSQDDPDLTEALRALAGHAPAGPSMAGVQRALRMRQRRRVILRTSSVLAVFVAIAGIAWWHRAPEVRAPSPPVIVHLSPEPGDRDPGFSLLSVGTFSPGSGSAIQTLRPAMSPSMPTFGMEMP